MTRHVNNGCADAGGRVYSPPPRRLPPSPGPRGTTAAPSIFAAARLIRRPMRRHGNRIKQKLRSRRDWEVGEGATGYSRSGSERAEKECLLFYFVIKCAASGGWLLFGESKSGDLQTAPASFCRARRARRTTYCCIRPTGTQRYSWTPVFWSDLQKSTQCAANNYR